MDLSIRLLVRRRSGGEPADVRVKLVADLPCHVEIHAQASRDDRVSMQGAVDADPQSIARKVEHDGAALEDAERSADMANRDLIGIGNFGSSYGRGLGFLGHSYSSARADLSGASAAEGTGKVAA